MDRSKEPTLQVITAGLDVNTSDGRRLAFASGAVQFIEAAELLFRTSNPPPSAMYTLVFHGIELLLKSHLASAGKSIQDLRQRPLGHNLVALYDAAVTEGVIHPNADERDYLIWANEYHDVPDGLRIRYDFIGATLPFIERYFEIAERIKMRPLC